MKCKSPKKRRYGRSSTLSIASTCARMKQIIEDTSPVTAEQLSLGRNLIAHTMSPGVVSIYDTTPEIQKLLVASAIALWAATFTSTPSSLKKSTAREYSKLLREIKKKLSKTSPTKSLSASTPRN